MPQRLTALEASALALDTAHNPRHVGTVDLFDAGPDGFDYERLIGLIRDRISYVPRYRQRVRQLPARLAGPVWVDDADFDLTFHVRGSALPRPGTMEQLREFVGRVMARPLDQARPLWEIYLVEGLERNRFALVAKSHLSLVDGIDTVDIGQVLLDTDKEALASTPSPWHPLPEPNPVELLAGALWQGARDPVIAVENVRGAVAGAIGVAVAVSEAVGGIGGTLGELAAEAMRGGRPRDSPLAGAVSQQRRVATISMPFADLKAVREEHRHTVNDVILAVIAGGLRSWLLTRGESVPSGSVLIALAPMSVLEEDGESTSLGSRVAPYVQSLPIGENNALMRLHQVAFATQAHKDAGRAIDARSLSDIAGFAPTTLHALGVRVAVDQVRKPHDVLITNVPGPQLPLYAAGSPMLASFPILPLAPGHLLAIGVTSYNGQVFFGLNADRDGLGDLDVLAHCFEDAKAELLDTTSTGANRRQPTRQASAAARQAAARKAEAKQAAALRSAGQKRAAVRKLASRAAALSQTPPVKPTPTSAASRTLVTTGNSKATATETTTAKKTSVKVTAAKKTPVGKKAAATRSRGKGTAAKKAPAKETAATKKAAAEKALAKKAPAKKAPAKQTPKPSTSAPVR